MSVLRRREWAAWRKTAVSIALEMILPASLNGQIRQGLGSIDSHFHTSPEGLRGLVIPCVDDAGPDMLAFQQ